MLLKDFASQKRGLLTTKANNIYRHIHLNVDTADMSVSTQMSTNIQVKEGRKQAGLKRKRKKKLKKIVIKKIIDYTYPRDRVSR